MKSILRIAFLIRSTTYDYENVSVHFTSYSKEDDVTIATFDIDPQAPKEQSVVIKKIPRSKVFPGNSDDFLSGVARSAEFVQIFWINRNRDKK